VILIFCHLRKQSPVRPLAVLQSRSDPSRSHKPSNSL